MNIEVSSTKNRPQTAVVTVGTSVVTSPAFVGLVRGINLKAPVSNSNAILIGNVNLSGNDANWFPLAPGDSLFLAVENSSQLSFKSTAASQSVYMIGL